jgi:hypothetical protein
MEEAKVIIEQRLLRQQRRAANCASYVGTREYRVYAPSRASGDPVKWRSQLAVHIPSGYGELSVPEPDRSNIVGAVFRELERSQSEAAKAEADAL